MEARAVPNTVQNSIAENYGQLSSALQLAADFIVSNGFEVATRSLRSIASESNLSPSSFSRLARAIGLVSDTNEDELEAVIDSLALAERVTIIGSLGSASFADYFAYLTSWFDGRWTVAGRNGVTLASTLLRMKKNDAVIVISKAPYAQRAIAATKMAAERGATIIVITDSHTFPAIKHAKHVFIQKVESPQFFPSYAATLVLIETLTGMLLARAGKQAVNEIQHVIEQNQQLEEIPHTL